MTLEEIESTLPNGFHDAELTSISVDYPKRRATIALSLWMAEVIEPAEQREAYRDAILTLDGLMFLVIEPPAPESKFATGNYLRIDEAHDRARLHVPAITALPSDCFVSGFFVDEWNAHIFLAARQATLVWTGETYSRA